MPSPQSVVVMTALVVILILALLIQQATSTRLALLFATGTTLGIVLYQSLFGFQGHGTPPREMKYVGRVGGVIAMILSVQLECFFTHAT